MGIQTGDLIDALRALAAGERNNGLLQMAGKKTVLGLAVDMLADYDALGPIAHLRELVEAEREGGRDG